MKPLIIAALVILSATNNCKFPSTEPAPISLNFDGTRYSSEKYDYPGGTDPIYPHEFRPEKSSFSFCIYRELLSADGTGCMLAIEVQEDCEFMLNTKYILTTRSEEKTDGYTFIKIHRYGADGKQTSNEYDATKGWIMFTDYQDSYTYEEHSKTMFRERYKKRTYGGHYLSGRFKFTVEDKETGETIEVTDGTFENLKSLKH